MCVTKLKKKSLPPQRNVCFLILLVSFKKLFPLKRILFFKLTSFSVKIKMVLKTCKINYNNIFRVFSTIFKLLQLIKKVIQKNFFNFFLCFCVQRFAPFAIGRFIKLNCKIIFQISCKFVN